MSVPSLAFRPVRAVWLMAFLTLACAPEPTAYELEAPSLNKGKGGGGGGGGGGDTGGDVTVSSVFPAAGAQGETLFQVKVAGAGFESGAKVAWERNGVADPLVRVLATRFKSSTEIEVDIAIDETALVTNYDVSVTLKSGKRGVGIESFEVKEGDPTATWMIPLDDGQLSFRSDGAYAANGMSVYANGVCGVSTRIFATTAGSHSGDATIKVDEVKGKNGCMRQVTIIYPDGFSETLRTFANLRKLQNTVSRIPVGETELRTLALAPNHVSKNPSRCGRLVFGVGDNGLGVGSHPVWVHRIDIQTWRIYSQQSPLNSAWCESTGEHFDMRVDFMIRVDGLLPW